MSQKNDRIGESKKLPNGLTATIIAYRNCKDITVKFSDGRVISGLTYSHFVKGDISGKHRHYSVISKDRIGETIRMNCGLLATVINYRTSKDIDVKFENGDIVTTRYQTFKNKEVLPLNTDSHFTTRKRARENWIGKTNVASNGMLIKCIDYKDNDHITVEFEDGYQCVVNVNAFNRGQITNPNFTIYDYQGTDHIGEKMINTQKHECTIIEYKRYNNITVKFDDGTVVNSTYGQFKTGKIENPNAPRIRIKYRTGETKTANCGLKMTITEYYKTNDIRVTFEDGAIVKTSYQSFTNGNVRHPTLKVRGIGTYACFDTKGIGTNVYECRCNICGYKDMLTPQQMMEHLMAHVGRETVMARLRNNSFGISSSYLLPY